MSASPELPLQTSFKEFVEIQQETVSAVLKQGGILVPIAQSPHPTAAQLSNYSLRNGSELVS
jgi:hypothetical protein